MNANVAKTGRQLQGIWKELGTSQRLSVVLATGVLVIGIIGVAWWSGSEGNYWGHNAIIRTHAFAECCGLPDLRGPKPFGGHIMSHDFVEAALLRRGGWAVHMVPGLAGSYEESPPSLIDLSVRDRRWCQGNLQHAAVLTSRGLSWISRLHLLTGILSYVSSPLWLLVPQRCHGVWLRALHGLNAALARGWKNLFAYQFVAVTHPRRAP